MFESSKEVNHMDMNIGRKVPTTSLGAEVTLYPAELWPRGTGLSLPCCCHDTDVIPYGMGLLDTVMLQQDLDML